MDSKRPFLGVLLILLVKQGRSPDRRLCMWGPSRRNPLTVYYEKGEGSVLVSGQLMKYFRSFSETDSEIHTDGAPDLSGVQYYIVITRMNL